MTSKKYIILTGLLCIYVSAFAQQVKGKVMDMDNRAIVGALARWQEGGTPATTNMEGVFILKKSEQSKHLIVSMAGFITDTFLLKNEKFIEVRLLEKTMQEVKIKGSKDAPIDAQVRLTELIGCNELNKLACCNLSESFENSNTIDVVYADGATGSKEIQMLGLDGAYSQIYFENMPWLRGMVQSVGLESVPGVWIDEIAVNKGAGSVVNGYESMAGQINLEYKKPRNTDRLFLNLFMSEIGKTDLNALASHRFNDAWAGELFLHSNFQPSKIDYNKDNFYDMAISHNYSVFNKWQFTPGDKFAAQAGVQLTYDLRNGGQINVPAGTPGYGIRMETIMSNVFAKTGFVLPTAGQSIGITYRFSRNTQTGYFGNKVLSNTENFAHVNAIFQSNLFGLEKHLLKAGASFFYDKLDEQMGNTLFNKYEKVPGVFAEYALNEQAFSMVGGLRYDYHNQWGSFVTPRLMMKWKVGENTSIRLSAGKGFRTVSLISENLGFLISSRQVNIQEALRPEESWNYGISFRHEQKIGTFNTETDITFFLTSFDNQIVIDLEQNSLLNFYNLKGRSSAYSFQIDQKWIFHRNFDVKWSYKNDYVQSYYTSAVLNKPLVLRDKILLNPEWRFYKDKMKVSTTILFNGPGRIPIKTNGESGISPWYTIWHALFTWMPNKQTDIYFGAENIFNYRQRVLILGTDDPYGQKFDAGMIWGPADGRRFYMGIKWKLNYK